MGFATGTLDVPERQQRAQRCKPKCQVPICQADGKEGYLFGLKIAMDIWKREAGEVWVWKQENSALMKRSDSVGLEMTVFVPSSFFPLCEERQALTCCWESSVWKCQSNTSPVWQFSCRAELDGTGLRAGGFVGFVRLHQILLLLLPEGSRMGDASSALTALQGSTLGTTLGTEDISLSQLLGLEMEMTD